MTRPSAPNLPDLNSGKPYPFKKVGGEPEDIFGETEKLGSGRVERPASAVNSSAPAPVAPAPMASNFGVQTMPSPTRPMAGPTYAPGAAPVRGGGSKILTVILIILFVAAIGLLGWWAYGKYFAKEKAPVENNLENSLQNLNDNLQNLEQENNNNEVVATPTEEQIIPTTTDDLTIDSDGDGLTDAREVELGINPNRVDTDLDGLSDFDEVEKWQTNPLNPDTDGDSFLDGLEVQNGYNPLGAGKMTAEQEILKNGGQTSYKNSSLCTDPPKGTAIGRDVYPIEPRYKDLEFLGQLFTAYKCGTERVGEIFGVSGTNYTLGSGIILKSSPSQTLISVLKSVGFTCTDGKSETVCREWDLNKTVKIDELMKLEPYYNEFQSDDCRNCG